MGKRPRASDRERPSTPEEALDLFDRLYEEGDLEAAAATAERALKKNPDHAALHHALGLALWGSGRAPSAAEALRRSVQLDPSVPEPHLDFASVLIDPLGYPQDALAALRAGRKAFRDPPSRAAMHALRARALLAMDDPHSAEAEMRKARKEAPEDPELASDHAEMQVEALLLAPARATLEEALRLDPEQARAHWLRAVLRDRAGEPGAAGDFEAAARLDPEAYFVPQRFDEEEFDRQVERALAEIPPRFRKHLANAEVAVEPFPDERLLRDQGVSPLLLGLFVGTPLTDRSFDHADLPPRILIFQRNLENVCRTRRQLVREIGITVRHEIGHLIGMEEEEIEDAGHA